ncbi:MAG: amidohydrolase family protein, partial [Lachnospiraceae bacterium]|nr:amidohydrolase family protein [Lachnospiraceae bacterium]
DPGVIGAAIENKNVYVELICDGVHIHPAMVRTVFSLFDADRICMISDSMMATGMRDGAYSLGGQKVRVTGKTATLEDGTIAGSASNLYDCLKVAVKEMGISLEDVVRACTLTPAKSLHLEKVCGSIQEGKNADFVIMDEELEIKMVVKDGRIV